MKFGIIKERKNPPDRRVVFSPNEIKTIQEQFPVVSFKVEPSDIRIFSDAEYQNLGIEVTDDLSDCEVLFGVKEIPVEALIIIICGVVMLFNMRYLNTLSLKIYNNNNL